MQALGGKMVTIYAFRCEDGTNLNLVLLPASQGDVRRMLGGLRFQPEAETGVVTGSDADSNNEQPFDAATMRPHRLLIGQERSFAASGPPCVSCGSSSVKHRAHQR